MSCTLHPGISAACPLEFSYHGIVHSIIAPILYYRGLQKVSASRAAVLGYLEPVCAILLSMVFLDEMPGHNSLLGGALILCSGYMTIRSGHKGGI